MIEGIEPDTIRRESEKMSGFLKEACTVLNTSSGQWLFGQNRPTELDAHLAVVLARLRDAGHESLIPEPLQVYMTMVTNSQGWIAVTHGRSTTDASQ